MLDRVAQTVLIPGATSGIGAAAALLFGDRGAHVAVAGRREKQGQHVARQIESSGGRAAFVRIDVTVPRNAEAGIAPAVDKPSSAGLGDFAYADARRTIGRHLEQVVLNDDGGRSVIANLFHTYARI